MKRIIITLFSALILCLFVLPAFSAAEVDLAPVNADEPAVTEPGYIYFEAPDNDSGWGDIGKLYCHISSKTDGEFYPWSSKNELCEDLHNGYWRYDISDLSFDRSGEYTLVFGTDSGSATYDLCFTSECLGDIVYCVKYSDTAAPSDGQRKLIARWKNNKDTVLPVLGYDSDGHNISIDGVDPSSAQTVWGTSSGGSYELYTPPVVEPTYNATSDELTEQDIIADKWDGINLRAVTIAIVSVSVVLGGAIIFLTVKLAKRNRPKK